MNRTTPFVRFLMRAPVLAAAVACVTALACGFACAVPSALADGGSLTVGIATLEAQATGDTVPVYRLYNRFNGDHHYTTAAGERDELVKIGWTYEGEAWTSPNTSSTSVYRLYNGNSGDHHYTTDANERDELVKIGWTYEGVAWYSAPSSGAPLYRLYNQWLTVGTHHYTASANERDELAKLGWQYEGVAWYGEGVGTVVSGDYAIMGTGATSVDQMVRRYSAMGKTYPSNMYLKYGAATIDQFCKILYEEATAEGVRPEVVFAQAMHETGWLQFGGDVKAEQCNFAGIGATGGGNPGNSFNTYGTNSVRMGLRAQVQHLKAYASTDSCANPVVDPRFSLVTRGSAPTVKALGGKWAVGSGYGDALMNQIQELLKA